MWWIEPGTRAAGVAEAIFNAVWLLLWLIPAAVFLAGSGSGLGLAAGVLLVVGALAARFSFDLSMAGRERRGDSFLPWMLIVRHEVAERTVVAVIGWYLALAALGGLLVFGVSDRVFVPVAATVYILSLLYVPASVACATRRPGARRHLTHRRALVGVVAAVVFYAALSAVQVTAGASTWRSAAIGFVFVVLVCAAWLRWFAGASRPQ